MFANIYTCFLPLSMTGVVGANDPDLSVALTRSTATFHSPQILYIISRNCYTSQGDPDSNPCWNINSFLSDISVFWSSTEKIIKKERAFSIIFVGLTGNPSQLPTVAVANPQFNKQLATANARWCLPSHALVDCIVDSSTVF